MNKYEKAINEISEVTELVVVLNKPLLVLNELVERATKKKVVITGFAITGELYGCPTCFYDMNTRIDLSRELFCPNCGQALEWDL